MTPAAHPGPTDAEQAVLAAVSEDSLLADLAGVVAIPSMGGSSAEVDVQHWIGGRLAELGTQVDLWSVDLDELRADPDYPGEEVERDHAWGCVGRTGGRPGDLPALILCGHTDVVPAIDGPGWPDGDPWRMRRQTDPDGGPDRVIGRGVCDMKGGLMAAVAALDALHRSGVRLARPLAVHAVVGEEDRGLGAFATLRRGHRGEACVIAEPTADAVVTANAGSLTFTLTVTGRSAHGSVRDTGVSAIEELLSVLEALRFLEARRQHGVDPLLAHLAMPYPLSVGTLAAGDWASTVPHEAVATGRYGVRLGETLDEAKADFGAAVTAACARDPWLADHPAVVEWTGGAFAPGALPVGDALYDDVAAAAEQAGAPRPEPLGAPYGSDLRLYAAAGIPTVQYGPGDITHAHAAGEEATVPSLVWAARSYALLAMRRCGVLP